MRQFETGATRDTDHSKFDYEGFLSPAVLTRFAAYMHKNRVQADGNLRSSDNWQKGMPMSAYTKSAFRHFVDWWTLHRQDGQLSERQLDELEDALCAVLFNAQGYLYELMRVRERSVNDVPAPAQAKVPLCTLCCNAPVAEPVRPELGYLCAACVAPYDGIPAAAIQDEYIKRPFFAKEPEFVEAGPNAWVAKR